MSLPILTPADLMAKHEELRRPWHTSYLAMYSSIWGGIVTDPVLMTVPVDDHLVHRADGVFDFFKCVDGRAYCMQPHLRRLEGSARGLTLTMPPEYTRVVDIIRATVQAGGHKNCTVRIMISRGPGGFTTDPTECPVSILYVIVCKLKITPPSKYENGVSIISAPVPVKPAFFANIKSCDYLGNVMIKKAAVEAGADYAVNWDENGFLAEGSTENIILVSEDRRLLVPALDRVLLGVTLSRVMELAETLVKEGVLTGIDVGRIDRQTAARCPEAMLTCTSFDVLPVTKWDGRAISDGRPGPVARRLTALIREEISGNGEMVTPMFD
ncbi:MAG: aminotransferase class IV [Deltaproteobacteria bacterium]|nr:aminotransferase class IV [Deltaproteobacteria bacterium]